MLFYTIVKSFQSDYTIFLLEMNENVAILIGMSQFVSGVMFLLMPQQEATD